MTSSGAEYQKSKHGIAMSKVVPSISSGGRRKRLRLGFSTGTAAVAAAQAALRHLLTGAGSKVVAVRLPLGFYLPIPIEMSLLENGTACASVIKDGGDDPDITHKAEIRARVRILAGPDARGSRQGVYLIAGTGVGIVTKAGLPVSVGEPAINPVPRQMFSDNLARELRFLASKRLEAVIRDEVGSERNAAVFVPFDSPVGEILAGAGVEVQIEVPRGKELAEHTLNPRLGIVGGISILGTTGIVKPFSHEAYEETIEAALSVASSSGCDTVILSTGGKSERFAQEMLPGYPVEAFVQIADFFAFAVRESSRFGFKEIIHSVFFGKAVKMAQGHAYTHAHSVPLELEQLSEFARHSGYDDRFCTELASANTARHALEILGAAGAWGVVRTVAAKALAESAKLAEEGARVRLLLFDYDGRLLADES
jgi:cobalt-precorrin-5B (C1)-methyltransferase